MDGILILNKSENKTSFKAISEVKHILGLNHVGHTGTLDPNTTGVLVIMIGKATKLLPLIEEKTKVYEAEVTLGVEYDTLDIYGNLVKEMAVNTNITEIDNALKSFIGKQLQVVPKVSSVKINGKKMYEYARKNIDIELPKKEIEIYDIKRTSDFTNNKFRFLISGSKGFYVRSVCRDLGYKLNTIGSMSYLKRLSSGEFKIEDSYTIEDIKNGNYKIIDLLDYLENKFQKLVVKDYLIKLVKNGVTLDERQIITDKPFLVYDSNNNLLALYNGINNKYKPVIIF